jgi:hypothetical protein
MVKEDEGFACLRQKFPKISKAQVKEGIIVGPQIKQILEEQGISTKLNAKETRVWKASGNVCRNILGKERAENYSEILHKLILSHSAVW